MSTLSLIAAPEVDKMTTINVSDYDNADMMTTLFSVMIAQEPYR